jgi:UDP-glucose 4-epimerase
MVLNGEAPTVYGDGTQKRCFTYMDDFIEGLILASERDPETPNTYNFGGTTETEIGELAEIIIEAADADMSPEYVDPEEVFDSEYEQPDRRIPDTSRAKEYLGWEAKTPVEEGVKRMIETERNISQN